MGSSPLSNMASLGSFIFLGLIFAIVFLISSICSGVVPQQPPTIFKNPSLANSLIISAISFAVWSYSPNWLGIPAFG